MPGDATADYQTYGPPKASTSAPVAAIAKTVEATGGDAPAEEDDEDIDLFGSDDEEVDEAAEKLKQERLAEYAAKKAGKAKPAAKVDLFLSTGCCSRLRLFTVIVRCHP